jgi:hypothetical protein
MNNEILVILECPICFDEIIDILELSCSHIYCKDCILKWKQKGKDICPLCREIITYVSYNNQKILLSYLDYDAYQLCIIKYNTTIYLTLLLLFTLFLFYYLDHNKDEDNNLNITNY